MNLRIAEAVARWTVRPAERPAPEYTTREELAQHLRMLMESDGRVCEIRSASVARVEAFIYICRSPDRRPFAQGVGSTPALAVCDAFLNCATERVASRRATAGDGSNVASGLAQR